MCYAAYHYGGVGQTVSQAAMENHIGVIALKAGARERLIIENGQALINSSTYLSGNERRCLIILWLRGKSITRGMN